jgi:hypothetical protein
VSADYVINASVDDGAKSIEAASLTLLQEDTTAARSIDPEPNTPDPIADELAAERALILSSFKTPRDSSPVHVKTIYGGWTPIH